MMYPMEGQTDIRAKYNKHRQRFVISAHSKNRL